jgi:HK97 family phage prohead protease
MERRNAAEYRTEGEGNIISGYAAVFTDANGNPSLSENLGGFREIVAPTAFNERSGKVLAFYNHDSSQVLGKEGTNLELSVDARGLRFSLVLPDTTTGRDVRELIRAGILSGVSFGFTVNKDSWTVVNNEKIRTLESVTLYEISPTANPAYPDTTVALRNLAERERSEARRKQAIARIKLMKWNF